MKISPKIPNSYRHQQVPQRTLLDGAPKKNPNILVWGLDMLVGHGNEAAFPDVSGLAPYSESHALAIRDTKSFHYDSSTIGLVDKSTGEYSHLDLDSDKTGRPFDLEAITPTGQDGHYLAVEGSRTLGRNPRLIELEVDAEGARTLNAIPLPDLDQEIEGLTLIQRDDGKSDILLGGRGAPGVDSKIYWGRLGEDGLTVDNAGQQGITVPAPFISESQRGITELIADDRGNLWASATATVGGIGEYRSVIYQLGKTSTDSEPPLVIEPGRAFTVEGSKVEGLLLSDQKIWAASDNESLDGRLDLLSPSSARL